MNEKTIYKGIDVKERPWFIFLHKKGRGATFLGRIYLRKDLFKDYLAGSPSVETISVLEHETTHFLNSGGKNVFKSIVHNLCYWLFPNFRFDEELRAIKSEMKVLKTNNQTFDIEKRAKFLSSFYYLYSSSYQRAHQELTRLWNEV